MLQFGDRIRAPHVRLATCAPGVFATGIEHGLQNRIGTERCLVHADGFFRNRKNADALDPARGAGEIFVNGIRAQADGFEQLSAAIAHVSRNTHLGHDLGQALADCLDVVVDRLIGRDVTGQIPVHAGQRFHRKIGVNGFGAVTGEHGEMVHFARSAGLDHQTRRRAQAGADQMLVDGRQRQQRRNGNLRGTDTPVADDQDVVATLDRVHRLGAQ